MTHATTSAKRRRRGVTAGAATSVLALGACGSSPSPIGYNAFLHTEGAEMVQLCEETFGSTTALSDRLGLTVYEPSVGDAPTGGCLYETSTGGVLGLGFSTTRPDGATLIAKQESFHAFLHLADASGRPLTLESDRATDLTEWLESRAAAVVDDSEEWLASLPTAAPDYASTTGFAHDEVAEDLESSLLTPGATVTVSAIATPRLLRIGADAEPMVPADGHDFLVTEFSVAPTHADGAEPTYEVLIDDQPAPEALAAAVLEVVDRAASEVAVSVPTDADLVLAVTTSDETQRISLRTGEPDDDGRGARLSQRHDGLASAAVTVPTKTDPSGRTEDVRVQRPFDQWAEWEVTTWTASHGWAPTGKTFLVLDLSAGASTNALPLTAADATVDVDGSVLDAASFDAETHRFTFVVPERPVRFTAQVRAQVDVAHLERGAWGWKPGSTVDGPWQYDWTVDVHA